MGGRQERYTTNNAVPNIAVQPSQMIFFFMAFPSPMPICSPAPCHAKKSGIHQQHQRQPEPQTASNGLEAIQPGHLPFLGTPTIAFSWSLAFEPVNGHFKPCAIAT